MYKTQSSATFTQTLTTLRLQHSEIRAIGAKRLANALQNNSVIFIVFPTTKYIHLYILLQTLTTLDFSRNEIGEKGAYRVANALENNTAILILS